MLIKETRNMTKPVVLSRKATVAKGALLVFLRPKLAQDAQIDLGPVLAGVTLLVQSLIANSGCGQTCIETSQWANQAAAALQKIADLVLGPIQERQNGLILEACKGAGFPVQEVQDRKCVVDVAGRTISRATEPEKKGK
jgi:hypothetical protein